MPQLRRLPWGISESAYNARDLELTYQYSNFGVPGLGLKRGLGETASSRPTRPRLPPWSIRAPRCANLARLAAAGARGRHGFYEALDYTPSRLPDDQNVAIVRAFMAHHQGMTIVAIADALLDGAMRERFHAEPCVQATELLLQERTPRDVAAARPLVRGRQVGRHQVARCRAFRRAAASRGALQATPATHLLSNGRYRHDAHGSGLRLQPLGRPGHHALARGCHLRRLGLLHFPRATSAAAPCGRPGFSRPPSSPTTTR